MDWDYYNFLKWNLDISLNVVNEDGSWGQFISKHAYVWVHKCEHQQHELSRPLSTLIDQ